MKKSIRIGGASGFWGDSVVATPQLLNNNNLDFIVYDYLAEITMSIMARARAKDSKQGYAIDFVSSVLKLNLRQIADQKVKILSNAGGVNPESCAEAIREIINDQKLDLKVAVILGDDLMERKEEFQSIKEMYSNIEFPQKDKIASINAYLGAFPIAQALKEGADIVITGRSVDSAVTLAACIYSFGWSETDYNELASGSLAGHIIECGPQCTGGNYSKWYEVENMHNIGYPIIEMQSDGNFLITKDKNLIHSVKKLISKILKSLPRKKIAEKSLKKNGLIIKVYSDQQIVNVINEIAPEHLELNIKYNKKILEKINNAGSICIGKYSAMAVTDYNVGTNHVLPTYGSAKFSSGLNVNEFNKKISHITLSKKGVEVIGKKAITLAEYEGLIGHAQSIKSRIRSN